MFDLNKALAEWRRQMLAAGIKSPMPLDELESHLRDDVEQQVRTGISAQQAFEAASKRIGPPHALKREFGKTSKGAEALMILACAALVAFIVWLSGFTFSQMQMGLREQILAYTAVTFTLVTACGWRYAVPHLPVISNRRKRMTIGWACIVSGFLCTSFFTNVILPHFERNHDGQLPAIGFWAVFPIAVFACLGLGLMMSDSDR